MADFKELLEEKVTSPKTLWDEAIKLLQTDVRWKALKSVGEKKNVFQNFIAKKQRDFVETERVRKRQAKADFQAMLREADFITHNSRFRDLQEQLKKDERFDKVDSEREKAELFEDYVMELEKAEKERLRSARVENLAAFRQLLSEIPELTSKTRWSEVKVMVKEDERFIALDGDDKYRLEAFDEFMLALSRKEAEERELLKEKKRALEKEQRAAFTVLLTELGEKGVITALTQWRVFRDSEEMKTEQRFTDMLEQSKTKSQDMFEDFVEELHAKYTKDRPLLKEAYKAADKVCMCVCVYVYIYKLFSRRRTRLRTRSVCVCVCVCVCMWVCVYVYIYKLFSRRRTRLRTMCVCVCVCVYHYVFCVHGYTFRWTSRRTYNTHIHTHTRIYT
jgi:pre-mRNA-processing factor 40